jgi:uncharacterized protein
MDIRNRHVFVTGGSRGIGEQLARKFAAAGARVSIAARSGDELDRIARDINGVAFLADLLDADEVEGLIAKVEAEVGPIDILVNNAGLDTADAFAKIEPSVIRNVVRVNLEAPMVLTRQVIPGMIKRGGGHLVFLSSLAGTSGFPGMAAYCGTKAGINNFVATLRLELGAYPIKTTLVAPGPVDTAMWQQLEDSAYETQMLKRLRRLQLIPMAKPDRLATRVVNAVQSNRKHVRHPARLSTSFWMGEAPRRVTETVLKGVVFKHD